jgi:predicted transcriptional regulator of viral defense system
MKTSEINSLKIFRQHNGLARTAELLRAGVHSRTIKDLVQDGKIEMVNRGLYRLTNLDYSESVSLIEACKAVPSGIICLSSALGFHELTTQNPIEVYLAIERGTWKPRIQYPPIRVFTFSGESFSAGVENHCIDKHQIRVYSAAKTICDCLKFRNKIGKDIALEALKDFIRQKNFDINELLRYAGICRVEKLLLQYLEAML